MTGRAKSSHTVLTSALVKGAPLNAAGTGESTQGAATKGPVIKAYAIGDTPVFNLPGAVVEVTVSAAVAQGAYLTPSGSAGKWMTAASGDYRILKANEAASADGDIIQAIVIDGGVVA